MQLGWGSGVLQGASGFCIFMMVVPGFPKVRGSFGFF